MKNQVQLSGRLGANPEVKIFESGKRMLRFTLAVPEFRRTADGQRVYDVQWHSVVMWEPLVDAAAEVLHKGSRVNIDGRLKKRSYTTADGQRRDLYEVVATEFRLPEKQAA